MTDATTEDRASILVKRRALRKAKKVKGRQFKETKKLEQAEKKKLILAKIRDKREQEKQKQLAKENNMGCWLCGESDHQKQYCPNRDQQDLSKTCFKCRRRGHTSQNCTSAYGPSAGIAASIYGPSSTSNSAPVCFNCGDSSHALRDCKKPRVDGGASFATCFVCEQVGHLSSQCPQSKTGIYPKGGCCKVCKSVNHLARDCPMGKISVDGNNLSNKKVFTDEDDTGDAMDSYHIETGEEGEAEDAEKTKKKKTKHVKF